MDGSQLLLLCFTAKIERGNDKIVCRKILSFSFFSSQQDRRQQEEQELEDIDETLNIVPDVIESDVRHPIPLGIIKEKFQCLLRFR